MLRLSRIYLLRSTTMIGAILLTVLAASSAMLGCKQSTTPPAVVAPTQGFIVTPLAANKASYGVAAANVDTNMQDAWGLAFNTAYGFAWVANRASGTSTVYDTTGKPGSHYQIKSRVGTAGTPTGIVQNSTNAFPVAGANNTANWMFSQLDGTIAAVVLSAGDTSFIVADRATSSSFTGLALANGSNGPHLYAPNVRNGSLDQFDPSYNRVQYSQNVAAGYTPFNAVVIDTQMFVTQAKTATVGGVPFVALGAGNGGYVDIYDLNGNFERNLIANGSLDEPWGVAIAPASFGSFAGKLLVGNFGDGTIHVYDRTNGSMLGTINDASGNPIAIPGLWALVVYNNTLYYTAGPNAGADGVFGKITLP